MSNILTKAADAKGRITLGPQVANRLVSVDRVTENKYVITLVRAVPEDEAWLYENPKAIAAVRNGLRQAREGRLKKGPNLKADRKIAGQL